MQTITIAPPKRSWFSLLSWAVVLAVLVVSWQGAEMAPLTLIKDGGNMATFAADFFPPDFSQWQDYLTEMLVTLQIAVWGTALAVVLSIPFGLMSAENLVPWWVYQPVRRLMDACRAINEMVFAMLVRGRRRPRPIRWRAGAVYPHHRRALQAAFRSGGSD